MYSIATEMGYTAQGRAGYIPHGVPKDTFKILDEKQSVLRKKHLGADELQKVEFVCFYNSRNALRKRTGNAIMAFKIFLESLPKEEREKVFFCMNTPPKDPEGQDLFRVIDDLGLKGRVGFVGKQIPADVLNEFYNMADCTLIQSSEEGFGLSCLESLMCGTPVIAGKTGGLQDQLYDPDTKDTFGILMEPDATSFIGSQTVPGIFSDHFDYRKTAQHISALYESKKKHSDKYKELWAGSRARESMLRRFNLEEVVKSWEDVIIEQIEKHKEKLSNRVVEVVEV